MQAQKSGKPEPKKPDMKKAPGQQDVKPTTRPDQKKPKHKK